MSTAAGGFGSGFRGCGGAGVRRDGFGSGRRTGLRGWFRAGPGGGIGTGLLGGPAGGRARRRAGAATVLLLLLAGCGMPGLGRARATPARAVPVMATIAHASAPPPLRVHSDRPVPGRRIPAESYVVVDANSGRVLAERNADRRVEPASLTKMATFDLALSAVLGGVTTLSARVPIGADVRRLDHRSGITLMGLDVAGPTVSLRALLLGCMLPSGNDAALAVADFLGGDTRAFVAQMNHLAARLGMQRTHFVNPNGLTAAGQLTTAHDMAVLARHIWLTHPGFARFTSAPSFDWHGMVLDNGNPLIGSDPRVFGMKGGWLPSSGYNLVIIARQAGKVLIAVAMGSQTLGQNARAIESLLNWGFAHDGGSRDRGQGPGQVTPAGRSLGRTVGVGTVGRHGSA